MSEFKGHMRYLYIVDFHQHAHSHPCSLIEIHALFLYIRHGKHIVLLNSGDPVQNMHNKVSFFLLNILKRLKCVYAGAVVDRVHRVLGIGITRPRQAKKKSLPSRNKPI